MCKFTIVLNGGIVISNRCFFHCVKSTEMSVKLRSPFLSSFAKRDTFVFVNTCSSVSKILRMSAGAQILNSIVITSSVDVIKFWNKMSMVIHPHKVMHSIRFTIYNSHTIPFRFDCTYDSKHGGTFYGFSTQQFAAVVDE